MQRSREQMRAIHARYAQAKGQVRQFERKHFPLHGSRTRARINRALAATAGIGVTAAGLTVFTGAGRRTGPFRAILGTSGERHVVQGGRVPDQPRPGWRGSQYRTGVFSQGSRQATAAETWLLEKSRTLGGPWTRGLRRLMGADSSRPAVHAKHAKIWERTSDLLERGRHPRTGRPLQAAVMAKLEAAKLRAASRMRGQRIWTVSGVPIDARVRAALNETINRRIEQASIWNSLGRGGLYEFIQNTSARGQDWGRRAATGFIENVAKKVERPIGRAYARAIKIPLWRANRAAVRGVRELGRRLVQSAA